MALKLITNYLNELEIKLNVELLSEMEISNLPGCVAVPLGK